MIIDDLGLIFSGDINGRFVEAYSSYDITKNSIVEIYVNNELYYRVTGNFDTAFYINRLLKNLTLCPEDARILRKDEVKQYTGKLLAGALEDSCYAVYAFAGGMGVGLHGYSCSVFWVPTRKELSRILVSY